MQEEEYLPYIFNGKVYFKGSEVEDVTVFIDGDTLMKWGSCKDVYEYYKTYMAVLGKQSDFLVVNLNSLGITSDDCCYIIRRLLEYTATGFGNMIRSKVYNTDFSEWLNEEKIAFPIS